MFLIVRSKKGRSHGSVLVDVARYAGLPALLVLFSLIDKTARRTLITDGSSHPDSRVKARAHFCRPPPRLSPFFFTTDDTCSPPAAFDLLLNIESL